jgi:FixJ family two-component response regulator
LPDAPIISIVDDNESVRLGTASLVRSAGWQTRIYASAEALLESAELEGTFCIISDVQMPGMSGLDMQSALIERGYAIPIIFITAFPDDAIRARALDNGAVCFLAKPVDTHQILSCLAGVRKDH